MQTQVIYDPKAKQAFPLVCSMWRELAKWCDEVLPGLLV
jgi:hypothetical protein